MAATPPRPASPVLRPLVVPKASHALQISPDLEALLKHDELTRCNSNSPTSAPTHRTTASPGFPISLPPPPPRKYKGSLKTGQDPYSTMRSKESQRSKAAAAAGADFWPGALPATFSPEGSAAGPPASSSSSRPVTPNPYLNPTPILRPIDTTDSGMAFSRPVMFLADTRFPLADEIPTPKLSEKTFPTEPPFELSPLATETRRPHRPSKAERFLWMGRDSLHLFSGSANGLKRQDSDGSDCDAVHDGQMGQLPTDSDTAAVSSSAPFFEPFGPPFTNDPPSLSSTPMSHHHPSPRVRSVDSATGRDYLSFIDFFSPSTSDEFSSCPIQDNASSRRQPCSLYSTSHHTLSSTSLASMQFAPPSPTSLTVPQLSPTYSHPDTSSPSVPLSSIMFAPPSPSAERICPTRLQPLSGPPSPYSPLEFAPIPGSPQDVVDKPSPTVPELVSERGRRLKSNKRSMSSSPYPAHHSTSPLPPTTNQLDASERADRIRRNRKLARVFGRTPGTEEPVTEQVEPRSSKKLHSPSLSALLTKPKNHRHAVSISISIKAPGRKTEPSTPWQTNGLWSPGDRRHSTPLATDSFKLFMDDEDVKAAKDPFGSHDLMDSLEAASTRSFIDLSDEEVHGDDLSGCSLLNPDPNALRGLHQSNSTPSLVESLDPEAQAELEKRRKREKLARLHRFLGSRVPPEAVTGSVFGPPLPPLVIPEQPNREHRLRGNKSAPPREFDRGKEELDEREKALNVRRAQKMERVFGTPPPQTLFHTRLSRPTVPVSQPTSPTGLNPYVLTLDIPSASRNPNQSAYMGKTAHRRGPSESSRCLLPHREDTPQSSPSSFAQSFADSFPGSMSGFRDILAQSSVYLNYQHSLNSLVDIIDRDDRKSLVELHRFLHGEVDESPSENDVPMNPRRASNATSFKSERRHSLPSNASITSLSSDFHTSPKTSQFQIRRRKAAKLTNFFGVDYRELIHDVLESIVKGVEEERKQGTLQPQEVEVLMHRVRSLRTMQDPFPC